VASRPPPAWIQHAPRATQEVQLIVSARPKKVKVVDPSTTQPASTPQHHPLQGRPCYCLSSPKGEEYRQTVTPLDELVFGPAIARIIEEGRRPGRCPRTFSPLLQSRFDQTRGAALDVGCRCFSCPVCSPRRKRVWLTHFLLKFHDHGGALFLTTVSRAK